MSYANNIIPWDRIHRPKYWFKPSHPNGIQQSGGSRRHRGRGTYNSMAGGEYVPKHFKINNLKVFIGNRRQLIPAEQSFPTPYTMTNHMMGSGISYTRGYPRVNGLGKINRRHEARGRVQY